MPRRPSRRQHKQQHLPGHKKEAEAASSSRPEPARDGSPRTVSASLAFFVRGTPRTPLTTCGPGHHSGTVWEAIGVVLADARGAVYEATSASAAPPPRPSIRPACRRVNPPHTKPPVSTEEAHRHRRPDDFGLVRRHIAARRQQRDHFGPSVCVCACVWARVCVGPGPGCCTVPWGGCPRRAPPPLYRAARPGSDRQQILDGVCTRARRAPLCIAATPTLHICQPLLQRPLANFSPVHVPVELLCFMVAIKYCTHSHKRTHTGTHTHPWRPLGGGLTPQPPWQGTEHLPSAAHSKATVHRALAFYALDFFLAAAEYSV